MIFPRNRAFCDTSFFFAALCPEDTNYEKSGEVLAFCLEKAITLYTTWDVVSETVTLLRYRADYKTAVLFLEKIKPTLSLVRYDDSVRSAAENVFKKLSKDKRLSFCDAISYVVVAHVLDNMLCLSFDRHFRNLGLTVYP